VREELNARNGGTGKEERMRREPKKKLRKIYINKSG
jgi:hypothetical protein